MLRRIGAVIGCTLLIFCAAFSSTWGEDVAPTEELPAEQNGNVSAPSSAWDKIKDEMTAYQNAKEESIKAEKTNLRSKADDDKRDINEKSTDERIKIETHLRDVDRELTQDNAFVPIRDKRQYIIDKIDFYRAKRQQMKSEFDALVERSENSKEFPMPSMGDIIRWARNGNYAPDIAINEWRSNIDRFFQNVLDKDKMILRKQVLEHQIDIIDDKLNYLQELLPQVENQLSLRLMIEKEEGSYKTWISGFFALLVGIVIACFFGIAYKRDKISEAIFSNQSGLQFITLFSLVIAIILFGVLKILEGKELAALLGAISGYVLGRATAGETAERAAKKTATEMQAYLAQPAQSPPSPPSPPPPPSLALAE